MNATERFAARTEALAYGERLRGLYTRTHGEVTPAAEDLIGMLVDLETLYLEAKADLDAQGLREPYNVTKYNKGTRENKAFAPLLKIQTQKARLLRELRLLPGSRKCTEPEEEDEIDELDDY